MQFSALTLSLTLLASSVLAVDIDIRNTADGVDWTHTTVALSTGSNCTALPIAANEVSLDVASEHGDHFACLFFASSGATCREPLGEAFSYRPFLALPGLAQSATCFET